jgi:hypothetical protein
MQRRRKRENIDLLGVTKAAVSGWENAHFRPANIRLVSRVLGISLDDLVR